MTRHFVKEFFDNKPLDGLRKAITGDWSEKNTKYHLDLLNPPAKAKRILEIGCGLGRLLIPLYDRGAKHCVGIDASESMIIEGLRLVGGRNIELIHCAGDGVIPIVLSGHFDFAFSIITFQHIPDTETVKRFLSEAYRLLAPGGQLSFQVLSHDVKPGRELWTYHDRGELFEHLVGLGFTGAWHEGGVWAIYQGKKAGAAVKKPRTKKTGKTKPRKPRPRTG